MNQLSSRETIVAAAELCIQNSRSLNSESLLLYENNHYARAAALMVLAYEELGKVLLLNILPSESESGRARIRVLFRSHQFKLTTLFSTLSSSDSDLVDSASFQNILDWAGELAASFDDIKLKGLYTDFNGKVPHNPLMSECAQESASYLIESYGPVLTCVNAIVNHKTFAAG